MKETLKNFFAMALATCMWLIPGLVVGAIIGMISYGFMMEVLVFVVVSAFVFGFGVFYARKNQRLQTALQFPLLPWF